MIHALLPLIGTVLDRVLPDEKSKAEAKMKLAEKALSGELEQAERDFKLVLGQQEINKVEAQSDSLLKSGWRPSAGWVCVAGLAYDFLVTPLLPWVLQVCGVDNVPPLPRIDNESLMVLLTAMLGLGVYRTTERIKGKI